MMVTTLRFEGFIYQSGQFRLPRSCKAVNELDHDVSRNTSFLIPKVYYLRFFKGKKNLNAVVKYLLEESSSTILFGLKCEMKRTSAVSYQDQGLDLVKVSCRIEESLLIELEAMSNYFRMSKCRLLSVMMRLKRLGWLRLVRRFGIIRDTTKFASLTYALTINPKAYPRPQYTSQIIEILKDSS